MARNKITDLRNHLFAQLERLSDDEAMKNPIAREREISRANAIKQIADSITATAKVELDTLKAVAEIGGNIKTDFVPIPGKEETKKLGA